MKRTRISSIMLLLTLCTLAACSNEETKNNNSSVSNESVSSSTSSQEHQASEKSSSVSRESETVSSESEKDSKTESSVSSEGNASNNKDSEVLSSGANSELNKILPMIRKASGNMYDTSDYFFIVDDIDSDTVQVEVHLQSPNGQEHTNTVAMYRYNKVANQLTQMDMQTGNWKQVN